MSKAGRQRADVALVACGLAESRARAQALIRAGHAYGGDIRIEKPGQMVVCDGSLHLKGRDHPWVSRGGIKLDKALSHFAVMPEGAVVLDIGASTGGFTHVALHHGAVRVFAVDVGHGQLAETLRADARVTVLEGTNARHLTGDDIPVPVDLLVCDASFISLKTLLPAGMALVRPGGHMIALIKPQFEVGRQRLGKGGVVRDPALHDTVCADISGWLGAQPGWTVAGLTESPVTGPDGNREFLIHAIKADAQATAR
ncbi:TlyA family RNA methyltransferase [Eilatimonas milleporae]|uniref:23S rRNA (Cytidine1920-2'-O)/16S rRNA (Cytidine1409-2'-O)-methyltransferase n=1 Tax=Eilatimonas milleporae TaxID=911205 RepID=A0A3M0CFM3_9PROT|nr:TlyA family RNA methyltransferase [Eilatimonas milleporae]RMB08401.1 23S rRNA (cytidine1920-2'-O)/16S rRNA (cytidine1409-2'-O)-methyltransferase [Eilatimonas milleporae]